MLSYKLDLRVVILTFIFNSKEMLEENILDYYFSDKREEVKIALEKIIKIINNNTSFYNIDEICLLINRYYDKEEYNRYTIKELYFIDRIGYLGKIFLSTRDGKFILKYWESSTSKVLGIYNDINKIAMWNSLSRKIYVDNLVLQFLVQSDMNDSRYLKQYGSIIHIEDLQLGQILSRGVAETHLHINAGINFEIKWHNLMNTDIEKLCFRAVGLLSYGTLKESDLKKYIITASIIRIVLAYYIKYRKDDVLISCFYEDIISRSSITSIANDTDIYTLEELYKILNKVKSIIFKNTVLEDESDSWSVKLNKRDFLAQIYNVYYEGYSLENLFLFEAFKLLKVKENNTVRSDQIFIKLLYKYILIKNIFYSYYNEDNKIKGLDKFTYNYHESSSINMNNNERLELALQCQLESKNIKKLEIRQSFPKNGKLSEKNIEKQLRKNLKFFFGYYKGYINNEIKKGNKIPLIGIIYHFIKENDDIEKCWYNNEEDNFKNIYYEKQRKLYFAQINAMRNIREEIPYLSNYIVGIDAASIEHSADPWVFAPIFRFARDGEHKILCKDDSIVNSISNLGFTFHVGEEFRHLLTGLRNIYEVIEYFKFRAGDRIGHGIALGIDVDKWANENSVIILSRIEYLEDLLWMWDMLTSSKRNIDYDINSIERKILEIASEIYGENKILTVNILYKAYLKKFEEYECDNKSFRKNEKCNYIKENREEMFFCHNINYCSAMNWDTKKLSKTNNCKIYLKKMYEPIEVKLNINEIHIMIELQDMVRDIISKKGIIVETNPTSNRVIGSINNIFEHYISNLNDTDSGNNILVSINTDDPSVFNSNINNEYAYIFYSLLNKGYDRTIALKWIDNIREIALQSSFIKDRDVSPQIVQKEVEFIYNRLSELEDY